jgi:hypothetical protein
MTDERVSLLRHSVATLAYRGGKAVRGAPPGFATFQAAAGSRSPGQILAHIGDLLDWALHLSRGERVWKDSEPLPWDEEVGRLFAGLRAFDERLASAEPLVTPPEKLFQGPIADALSHVGQIALLRRLAGAPIRGENYFVAEITTGRVGPEQATPRREFH